LHGGEWAAACFRHGDSFYAGAKRDRNVIDDAGVVSARKRKMDEVEGE
jgi:hypothetical protein